jgi:hypothetical protein
MIRTLVFCFALCCPVFAQSGQAPIVADPPKGVSIPNIIQSFARKENEFKQALEQYRYTRDVIVTASCQYGQSGVYHLTVDVGFDRKGNRVENATPVNSTARCIEITKEDLDAFRSQSLFVLTTDEIQNYQINYAGEQQEGELRFYVFDVSPVAVQAGTEYFDGRVWVETRDLVIVKTHGRIAPMRDKKRKAKENLIPAVMTWRGQIDGRYWFPIQSRTEDILHFSSGDVKIDESIKLTDYKAAWHPK